jgi:hypothetical protein
MHAVVPRHLGLSLSALLSDFEALLLHGETHPLTGLPARATSAFFQAAQQRTHRTAVGEANRSLWPDFLNSSEIFACDARAGFNRTQKQCSTSAYLDVEGRRAGTQKRTPHAEEMAAGGDGLGLQEEELEVFRLAG